LFVTRLLTAAALIAALLAVLFWLERRELGAAVAVIVALGAGEWARLAGLGAWRMAGYALLCAVLFVLLDQGILQGLAPAALWVGTVFWIVLVPLWLARGVTAKARPALLIAGVAALIPAALALAALPPQRALLALGLVWVADSAAYLAGRAFGKRKLAPGISPNKTWEGLAGGAAATLIYAIICGMFTPDLGARMQGAIWVLFVAGALLLFALGVLGDLFESALKRQAGAKDSGRLLPGHGGVLDRVDSAAAVLPVAALLLQALAAA
jgi:phosphatidate cytidylyltransferase